MRVNRKSSFISGFLCVFVLTASAAFAQAPGDLGSRFARATITENQKPLLMGTIFEDTADNLVVLGAPLADVIARAYGVQAFRVVDAPDWVFEAHLYDIEAVPPPSALIKANDTQMLRSLLADRFGLRVYRGTREVTMPVLDADLGMQRALSVTTLADKITRYASRRPVTSVVVDGRRARYVMRRLPILVGANRTLVNARALVEGLTRAVREPVLDLTGLTEVYVIDAPAVRALPENIDLMTGALERSGLSFERRTVPMDVLVVTHIERPVLDSVDR
jgi:uncharacterized protein (TIGR03435 family)